MSADPSIWRTLGISATSDALAIRRAYTVKLKVTNPEDDAEGFKTLRAAYEAALQWARARVARAPEPKAAPAPAASVAPSDTHDAAAASAETHIDSDLSELQKAFDALYATLATPTSNVDARAARALAAFMSSRALANVNVEREAERRLAELLAATLPRSDSLLLDAAKRFGWLKAGLHATPAVAAVLARLEDLAFLESVEKKDSRHYAAFRGLRRRKVPIWSWLRAHVQTGGMTGEYQLLQTIRLQYPTLLPMLNAEAVAWWDRVTSRPRVSALLLLLGLAAGVIFLGIAWANDAPLVVSLWAFGLPVGFAFGKLYLHDLPRFFVTKKWPMRLPTWLASGWLPLAVLCLAGSVFGIELPALTSVTTAFGLLALLWAVIVRTSWSGERNELLATLLFPQLVLAFWWFGSFEQLPPGATKAMWVPFFALACASSVGAGTLRIWLRSLSLSQQRSIAALLTVLSIAAALLLWLLAPALEWRHACAALVLAVIALQRPLTFALTLPQQRARLGYGLVAVIGLIFAAILEPTAAELRARGVMLCGGGLVLLATSMLSTAMAAWNELRSGASR